MKRFVFIAGVIHNGHAKEKYVEVEADSEPESIYDAKKGVSKWLTSLGMIASDLKRFDLVSVRAI